MAQRVNYKGPEFAIQQSPGVQISTGFARNLDAMANSVARINDAVQDDLDRTAKAEGIQQGVVDGSNGDLNRGLLYKPTIRGQAYTASALDQYEKTTELKARTTIEGMYAQHRADPKRLQTQLEAWSNGAIQEMPENLRAPFALRFKILSQASIARANENYTALAKAKDEAAVIELDNRVRIDADRVAQGLFSGNTQLREASWAAMMQSRNEIEQAYSRTVTDATGAKVPVFDPAKKAKALLSFDQQVTESGMKGWFDAQPDKVKALQEFRAGNVKATLIGPDGKAMVIDPVKGSDAHPWRLSSEGLQKMANWMRSTVSAEIGLQNSLIEQQEKTERRRDDAMLTQMLRVPEGNPGAVAAVLGVIESTTRDPKTIEAARRYKTEYGTGTTSDPIKEMAAIADFADGKITTTADILTLSGVSDATKKTLLNGLNSKQNADFFMNTNDYKAAVDMVNTALGAEVPPGTVISNPDAFMRAREAQRKALLNQLVTGGIEAGRSGKPFDPVKVVTDGLARRGENAALKKDVQAELRDLGRQQTELRQRQQGPSAQRLPADAFAAQMNDLAARSRQLQERLDTLQ